MALGGSQVVFTRWHRTTKAMKKISARLAKRHVFTGKRDMTVSGLKKNDLVKNKHGKVVSKKKSQSRWMFAVARARKELNITGFTPIKKGSDWHKLATTYNHYWTFIKKAGGFTSGRPCTVIFRLKKLEGQEVSTEQLGRRV